MCSNFLYTTPYEFWVGWGRHCCARGPFVYLSFLSFLVLKKFRVHNLLSLLM
jgi:hypothetical protein